MLCKQQPPQFHDIKLHVDTDLYDKLVLTDLTQHDYNKSYRLAIPSDPRFDIKVSVNKSKMFVDVGCTNDSLPYTPNGFGELQSLMGVVIF